MNARQKMIKYRERMNLDYKYLGLQCNVSSGLLAMVERGHVTHPNIVKRIQKFYKLTDREAEELLPENRRPFEAAHANPGRLRRAVSPGRRHAAVLHAAHEPVPPRPAGRLCGNGRIR